MTKYLELVATPDTVHNNDGENSSEQYSYRGTTDTSWEIHHLKLHEKDVYRSFPVDDAKVGDKFFAVVAIYSTGNSFEYDYGGEIELVSLHKNEALAKENCENLKGKKTDYTMTIKLDSGGEIKRTCYWDGYFESLDSITCMELLVK